MALGSELSKIVNLTDSSISELNKAYRQLLMVIGSAPDTYRDYQLESKTPEALAILKEQYEAMLVLKELSEEYSKGVKSSSSASIDNLVNQLEKMLNSPRTIPKQWSAFKDNIVSLGSWELSMKEQPLEIDYILVASKDTKMPKAEAGFFQKLSHEAKQFLASFKEDYDSIGEVYEGKALDVWILADGTNVTSMTGSGRDQATVIKELVDNYFVAETGIPVNVKLVNKDVLLSATLAGKGPDVALNVAGKEPINYALRNAVVDLSEFEDFDEVSKWFYEDAITQFSFNGGIYALPQTMSFHVMFYRADIFKDLGLEVPKTWDEFYEALAVIQKNNMNVGIFPDYTTFAMFLYQHGGTYYSDDSKRSGLDTEEAVAAFKQWSGNYVNYRMPVTFDFANRFRTGEMPLSIGDYTNYNYLSVFAPEIRGLWGFTLVPGYEREDGTLDRSVSAWESASIIMKTSKQKENAWEFLKWWMSAKTQSDYGNEIENVLGVSGRVATANIEALSNLAWASKDYKQLMGELKWVKAIPEIPGSYYTERNIKNAFYTVYNNNEDPRETLQDIVKTINTEIRSKREEFNLPTD
ncbi:MAG: extracellular solute-binding protein [Lachnospiraceae bacterium]|nr:extracellular solute-binding protein [Lachnospiraceae bacterium]